MARSGNPVHAGGLSLSASTDVEGKTMNRLIRIGLAVPICAALGLGVPGFAQTTRPAPLPVGTTVPPAGQPVTGDPTKPLPPEPANVLDRSGFTPGPNVLTEAQVRDQLESEGYRRANFNKGPDGIWHGTATKDGAPVRGSIDAPGNITKQTDKAAAE